MGLRVLIIRNAYQQDAGGAEQYALNLSIALKGLGHQPILVTKVKNILKKAEQENIKTIVGLWHNTQKWDRFYYVRYPVFTLWYMYIILRHRIDVVHPQGRDDFVFATRAAKLLGKKVIWTDHADLKYVLDNVNHYNPRMRGWIMKAAKHADAVICASHNEKKEIEAVASDMPSLTVIHNGVFVPKDVKPVPKSNKIVIGTNARLVPAKGIGELLEAFAAVHSDDMDLWLLGGVSGNKDRYDKKIAELGIAERVKVWDYVNNPNNVVSSMDIFVHASYHEAFSLAIIEAAMLARPIIATKVGGTPEIIDDECGILVPAKDAPALAGALKDLITDKSRRQRLGEKAKDKALKEFDFLKIVENKILPLYLSRDKR